MSDDATQSGWEKSAENWIRCVDRGDRNREFLLDQAMLDLVGEAKGIKALDVGCGEGRFCRILAKRGAQITGLEPTTHLIETARERDPAGSYIQGRGEELPFEDDSFDLVIAYLVLVDIPDFRSAIKEMARVVRSGGRILVANVNPFASTRATAWYRNENGEKLHVAVEDYYEEKAIPLKWSGIEIINYHRSLEAYMSAFLGEGLILRQYLEPRPTAEAVELSPEMLDEYRVPLFHVMLWARPEVSGSVTSASSEPGKEIESVKMADGVVQPYVESKGSVRDPREATHSEIAAVVERIVKVEGPATIRNVIDRYRCSFGLGSFRGSTREAVDNGISRAVRTGLVEVIETDDSDKSGNVLDIPGAPNVVLRERGPRALEDIPIAELAALAIHLRLAETDGETAHRRILEFYGFKRLTLGVTDRLNRAMSEVTRLST